MSRARLPLVLALVVCALAALPAAASALVGFASPSKNIGCYMDAKSVRCDIRSKDWSVAKPKGCDFDYGQGLFVNRRGRGHVVCAGDTALNSERILRYGKTIRRGSIRCTSRESGMTCRNGHGHGFRLAKGSYKLF